MVTFTRPNGGMVAVNPLQVLTVESTGVGTSVRMRDNQLVRVEEDYLAVVRKLAGALLTREMHV